MSRIEINTLAKTFDGRDVLDDVSLTIEPGRSLALIGPTAAGKTVLLKCLVGLYAPDRGEILIDGENVSQPDAREQQLDDRIGMLFQQNALFDSLAVWENIGFRLMARGATRAEARARAEELLPQVGLPISTADLFPADLSGGMQKRVGFARAVATSPDILLLDNPTAGLLQKLIFDYLDNPK